MGFNLTTNNNNMKTILIIGAICIALTSALPSSDDIVPEEDLVKVVQEASAPNCDKIYNDDKTDGKTTRCKCDDKSCKKCSLGYAWADECSPAKPAPAAAKKCVCSVDTGRGSPKVIETSKSYKTDGTAAKWDWAKLHSGHYRSITCQGCLAVTLVDDDSAGHVQSVVMGSKSGKADCCKKKCSHSAESFFCTHDLCDDVKTIYLNGAC